MSGVSKPWADAALSLVIDLTDMPYVNTGAVLAAACRHGGGSVRHIRGISVRDAPRAMLSLRNCPNLCTLEGVGFADIYTASLLFVTCPALKSVSGMVLEAYCDHRHWSDRVVVRSIDAARAVLGDDHTNHVRIHFECDVTAADVDALAAIIDAHNYAGYDSVQTNWRAYDSSPDVTTVECTGPFYFPPTMSLTNLHSLFIEDTSGRQYDRFNHNDMIVLSRVVPTSSLRVFSLILGGDDEFDIDPIHYVWLIDACAAAPHMREVTIMNEVAEGTAESCRVKWAALARLVRRGPPLLAVRAMWSSSTEQDGDADASIEAVTALEDARGLKRLAIHQTAMGDRCFAWLEKAMRERRLTNANVENIECTDRIMTGADRYFPALEEAARSVSIVLSD